MNATDEWTIDERVGDELERRGWRRNGCYIGQGIRDRWKAAHDAIRAMIENECKGGDE